jgi:prefoldin subunit 5
MHEQIQARIEALRKELELGQQRMHDLEQQLTQLRDTMLRISGAIQVLEELQAQDTPAAAPPDAAPGAEQKG